jgi:hypothetical protein
MAAMVALVLAGMPALGGPQASNSAPPGQSPEAGQGPRAKVTNPHGPTIGSCQNCHTYTSWKPIRSMPEFNHDETRYPLRGMHQDVGCAKCHKSMVFKNVSTHCADCHADLHRGQFGANCESCHSVKGWQVSTSAIQNHTNRFPLVGAHAMAQCADCHKGAAAGQFMGLSTQCYSCHAQDANNAPIDHSSFPKNCESCHSVDTWFGARFDHLAVTGYALTGMHATLECTACHTNNKFKGTPSDCYSCHQADFTKTTNPPHVPAGLPHDCANCHSTTDWLNAKFDHNAFTKFPLTGRHVGVQCVQCHVNNQFANTATDCYSCHKADFTSANNPPHVAAGFPTSCQQCHTTSGWSPSSFDHSKTAFPLTGAHVSTQCAQCHVNNNYTSLPTDCYGCHKNDFNNANNPGHVAAGFPTNCTLCHNTSSWLNSTFDHNKTAFPLTGAHITVACAQCHTNNNYTSLPHDCYSCHKADFISTNNPAHVPAGFPTDCTVCHNTSSWAGANFDHSKTRFPLTGAHITVQCSQCHANNVFAGTPTACFNCHQTDFTGTTNPPHAATNLPHDCSICHSTTNWLNASFNHTLYGNYALTGMHATLTCAQCHTNNSYVNTPVDCYSCHKADFTGTTNPNHVTSGFPTDCSICHTTSGWSPSSFDHSKTTFPLTGAHVTVACSQCHTNNNYTTLPTKCFGCHQKDYNSASNPAHAAAGFPTDCTVCHTTTSWAGAVFDHSKTPFPLTGAHVSVACNQCHVNNVFAGTPTDCYSCHKADYTGTTNPNHTSAGFPTTCATCHTTTTWAGATFNHTWFPTNHGGAKGVCATCHTNSADYAVFTCTNCHAKTATDRKHGGVKGYVYNSVNCYACHRRG